ncbi:hypothetical protein D3C81_1543170 [compost metagenome]
MQYQWDIDHFTNFCQTLEINFRGFGIETVRGADSDGETVYTSTFDKTFCFLRICQESAFCIHAHVIFNATQTTQFSFNAAIFGVAKIHHRFHQLHVFFEREVAAVNHRATHSSVHLTTDIVQRFVMVKMQCQRHVIGCGVGVA